MAKLAKKKQATGWGGIREGSGRPEGTKVKEATTVMRVPASLVPKVQKMIEEHRSKQS